MQYYKKTAIWWHLGKIMFKVVSSVKMLIARNIKNKKK